MDKTYIIGGAAYVVVAAVYGIRATVGWVRVFDRHYAPPKLTILREWAGMGLRSVAWPVSLLGAAVGGAVDCVRWAWALRPVWKSRGCWREFDRYWTVTKDGIELVISMFGPKGSTCYDARLQCGINYADPCEYGPQLFARSITARLLAEDRYEITVKYAKPQTGQTSGVITGATLTIGDQSFKMKTDSGVAIKSGDDVSVSFTHVGGNAATGTVTLDVEEIDDSPKCCACGKPATRFEVEQLEVEPDWRTMERRFVPGLKSWFCDDH